MHRFTNAADALDPSKLSAVLGPVREITRTPMKTVGFSAARHERLQAGLMNGDVRHLVVKRVRVADDWVACRSGDKVGREAALLMEPSLGAVWEAIESPYLAFWTDGVEFVLVMEDLSPFLFPDIRAPLTLDQEEQLLAALSSMHARFWDSAVLDLPWLARPRHAIGLLDPRSGASDEAIADLPREFGQALLRGWSAAFRNLPAPIAAELSRPADEVAREWSELPRTLLHGDVKVANFALVVGGKVAAFDWAMMGAGPVSLDVGWYLAVNASRLARPKDEFLVRYRSLLEQRRGGPIFDTLWNSLVRGAVVSGARMLLWSKALALEANGPGARQEWAWWVEHLTTALE